MMLNVHFMSFNLKKTWAHTGLVQATNQMLWKWILKWNPQIILVVRLSQLYWSLSPSSLYRQQLCSGKRPGAVALPHRLLLRRFLWAHWLRPCRAHAEELRLSLPVRPGNKWPVNGPDPRSPGWEEGVQDRVGLLQEGRWDCTSVHLCIYYYFDLPLTVWWPVRLFIVKTNQYLLRYSSAATWPEDRS